MLRYEPQWYPSPIDLPEGQSGKFCVRHRIIPAGQEVTIVGIRQALLRGRRPVKGVTKEPLRIHELVEEGHGAWMTDLPEELNQIAEMLYVVKPRGRVLVGGLGLGIVARALLTCPPVRSVTVVERSWDVIRLCAKPGGFGTVCDDIATFLNVEPDPYDYYLLDTWCGTNEGTWWEEVLPLRRIIRRRWGCKPMIHCWAEDIMQGQLFRTLTSVAPHWYYSYLPVPMTAASARAFLRNVGFPAWERRYGAAVDRYAAEAQERATEATPDADS